MTVEVREIHIGASKTVKRFTSSKGSGEKIKKRRKRIICFIRNLVSTTSAINVKLSLDYSIKSSKLN
jgi:hypothetical protein